MRQDDQNSATNNNSDKPQQNPINGQHSGQHDRFFRAIMQNGPVYREFMREHLPKHIHKQLDYESLQPIQQSYVDEKLKEGISDLVFQAQVAGADSRICVLIEHQSSPDKTLPLRIHYYVANLLMRLQQENPGRKPPAVYAMALYHGSTTPYPYSLSLFDCIDDPLNIMQDSMLEGAPLLDLNTLADEDLAKLHWLYPCLVAMKYVRSPDLLRKFLLSYATVDWSDDEQLASKLLAILLKYVLRMIDVELTQLTELYDIMNHEQLTESKRRDIMNLAERIENIGFKKGQEQGIEKGMEQGIEQGREQGQALLLLSLLEQRFGCLPADLSLRLQKANAEDVQQWSSRLFSAKSLKDVFH